MNKKIIENLNKEIKSLMNKDFDLRKSLEKLEKRFIYIKIVNKEYKYLSLL